MLQQNKNLKVIRKNFVKKCGELFFEIAERTRMIRTNSVAVSKNPKLGIFTSVLRIDPSLLTFFVSRMKDGQNDIYYIYITGEIKQKAVENSPSLEKMKKNGYEALFMHG